MTMTLSAVVPGCNLPERLLNHQTFSHEEAKAIMLAITNGAVNESQITALITAYRMRGITIEELAGFREALLEQSLPVTLPAEDAIDIVGTGGDGKGTFNISTLSAFVVAGAGCRVIKHGNHGVTSVSGSSDVLHYLGYRFTAEQDVLHRQLEQAGLCFLHAPLFHPAMKRVAQIRRDLGVRSLFNLLGPLTNPARPAYLLLGANTAAVARMFHYYLQETTTVYKVLHALDGYDEISLTGPVRLYSAAEDKVTDPVELGFAPVAPESLHAGKDIQAAATLFMNVLQHCATAAQIDIVVANSAMAIHCMEPTLTFETCAAMARESLQSGRALQTFKKALAIH